MATRLTVDETRISFDKIREQIKDIESSIMAIFHNGTGPLGTDKEIGKTCALTVEQLKSARLKIERLICWFDS